MLLLTVPKCPVSTDSTVGEGCFSLYAYSERQQKNESHPCLSRGPPLRILYRVDSSETNKHSAEEIGGSRLQGKAHVC